MSQITAFRDNGSVEVRFRSDRKDAPVSICCAYPVVAQLLYVSDKARLIDFGVFELDFTLSRGFIFRKEAIQSCAGDPEDFGSLSLIIFDDFENVLNVATLHFFE